MTTRTLDRASRFPRTVGDAQRFMRARLLNAAAVDEATLASIITKLERREPLSAREISVMRRVTDIGDVNTCDTDHRIRQDDGAGGREVTFSTV